MRRYCLHPFCLLVWRFQPLCIFFSALALTVPYRHCCLLHTGWLGVVYYLPMPSPPCTCKRLFFFRTCHLTFAFVGGFTTTVHSVTCRDRRCGFGWLHITRWTVAAWNVMWILYRAILFRLARTVTGWFGCCRQLLPGGSLVLVCFCWRLPPYLHHYCALPALTYITEHAITDVVRF